MTTVRGDVSINISGFEKFLRNWIDNNNLATILSVHSALGENTEAIARWVTTLPEGLPHIRPLLYVFNDKRRQPLSKKKVRVLCEYTDLLLDYVIYIFKYYEYDFKLDGTEIDKHDEDNKSLAKRLTKIYKIISTYIIGNPDLSIKELRGNIGYKSKHRKIFKTAQDKTIVETISETLGIARGQSQETDYNVTPNTTPLHPSLLGTPPPSPRGGTRKIRRYNNRRKTSRLSIVRPK
jgi:hypothetical protein